MRLKNRIQQVAKSNLLEILFSGGVAYITILAALRRTVQKCESCNKFLNSKLAIPNDAYFSQLYKILHPVFFVFLLAIKSAEC